MERMKRIGIRVVVTFIVSFVSFTNITSAQTNMNKDQSLNAKQQSIVTISAFTAKGDLENLRKALG
jgi:4-carboxymuconolactone decarboxylase